MSDSKHTRPADVADRLVRAQVADRLFGRSAPVSIGRFKVLRLLGAGGMGQVFAADDPELGRQVALKVVRQFGDADPDKARARLEREARAQAKLAHPNVVTLYEVGRYDDGLYIAMELVEGPTLRAWLDEARHGWREVLAMFVQAGQGLAAAHRRGLVHRDFKPENVLIDSEDGRARVADFGVVRVLDANADDEQPAGAGPAPAAARATATRGGVGTPAYMAPEQMGSGDVDSRTDQYGFCVALYEALVGSLPHETLSDGRDLGPPRRVLGVIRRGLSDSPQRRWPDMPALLAALERAARRRRLGLVLAGAGLVVVGGTAWWWAAPRCEDAASLAGVWDEEIRASVERGLSESEVVYAAAAWPAAAAALDRYASAWTEQRVAACALERNRAPAAAAKSEDCLEAQREGLRGLAAALAQGRADATANAVHLATSLPEPALCNDEQHLVSWFLPNDDAEARERDDARRSLAAAGIELTAARTRASDNDFRGRVDRGRAEAQTARTAAAALGDAALEARALFLLGQLAELDGDLKLSETLLDQSAARAEAVRDDRAKVRALSYQVYVIGRRSDRLGEARQVAARATEILAALGDPPLLRAHLLANLGTVKARGGAQEDRQSAVADLREAVALLADTLGEDHPDVVMARVNLGNALGRVSDNDASLRELEQAAEAAARLWAGQHPLAAKVDGMLGMALIRKGAFDRAVPRLRSALSANIASFGPEHHEVANAHYNLAIGLQRLDQHEEAAEHLTTGLAQRERAAGARSATFIPWLYALGRSQLALEREDEAAASLQRALELCEVDGASARDFARVRFALAQALVGRDPVRARMLARRAAETYRTDERWGKKLRAVEGFLEGMEGG